MSRIGFFAAFVGLSLAGATCARRSPAPAVQPAALTPAVPVAAAWIPPNEILLPAGFEPTFIGASPLVRRFPPKVDFIDDHPQDFIRVYGRFNGQLCGFAVGPSGRHALAAPEARRCAFEALAPEVSVALKPMLWSRSVDNGVWALEGVGADREWAVDAAQLARLSERLGLPDLTDYGPLSLAWVRFADGTGVGAELRLTTSPMADLARFDLARRFGSSRRYRGEVKAWGAHRKFHWVTRLDGGGAGLALDGLILRLGIVAGAEWSVPLERLLSGLPEGPKDITIPFLDNLTVEPVTGRGLRLSVDRSPLPAALLLGQLGRRMADYTPTDEE
jgi:hypothetical protein